MPNEPPFDPASITRPVPSLLTYYVIIAALTVIGFPFVVIPLYAKYHTLRYHFDDEGVSMSWGLLFKREIYLTYRRMQDIHVRRDFIQRWLGLATIAVQTASGASGAEMSIEGITEPDRLRDYLYSRMRGVREDAERQPSDAAPGPADEALALLREIRDELRSRRTDKGNPT